MSLVFHIAIDVHNIAADFRLPHYASFSLRFHYTLLLPISCCHCIRQLMPPPDIAFDWFHYTQPCCHYVSIFSLHITSCHTIVDTLGHIDTFFFLYAFFHRYITHTTLINGFLLFFDAGRHYRLAMLRHIASQPGYVIDTLSPLLRW